MLVLGLDPSLTGFGWAVHDTEAEGQARCPLRGRWTTKAKDLFVERNTVMREHVRKLVLDTGIVRLGVEFPIFGELYSEGMYGLFLFVCEALWTEKRDAVFFSPMQTKAHARLHLGRPKTWKMLKPDMIEAAKADTGGKGRWSNDEADAYWAARTGARFWMLYDGLITIADLTPVEQQQFTKIHTFQRGIKAGRTVRPGILFREDERFFRWSEVDDADEKYPRQEGPCQEGPRQEGGQEGPG